MWLGIGDTKVWVYEGQRMIAPQRILAVGNRVYVIYIGVYCTHFKFLKLKVRIFRYDHCRYPRRPHRRPSLSPANPHMPQAHAPPCPAAADSSKYISTYKGRFFLFLYLHTWYIQSLLTYVFFLPSIFLDLLVARSVSWHETVYMYK